MANPSQPMSDPDRYFNLHSTGSQEWWYFDAISDDGRDVLVIVFYAGCPFDPAYGVASRKVIRSGRGTAPDPLDHCAVSVGWYRPGNPGPKRAGPGRPGPESIAYALNVYRRDDFESLGSPLQVRVSNCSMTRDAEGSYQLSIETPDTDRRRMIRASVQFRPELGNVPFEANFGKPGADHRWMLAAARCRVEGDLSIDGLPTTRFQGKGYHDHNAGALELSETIRRWNWGRVHLNGRTLVYYDSIAQDGAHHSEWLPRAGEQGPIVETPGVVELLELKRTWFGVETPGLIRIEAEGEAVLIRPKFLVDSGPFYLRWVSDWEFKTTDGRVERGTGIHEVLHTRLLNHWLCNWMIPFRLRRSSAIPGGIGPRRG